MIVEDCILIDGEGWSVLTQIIGVPVYSCVHGLRIQTTEKTIYRFYSIFYDRFFDVPKDSFTEEIYIEADCCYVEWSDDLSINEKVLFYSGSMELSRGRIKSFHDGTITIISNNAAYDVDKALAIKFNHHYKNVALCKNKTRRCQCGAIKTQPIKQYRS